MTTCLMVLKDLIAKFLYDGYHCIVYSLDLLAAFDLLRVDLLFEKLLGVNLDGLLKFVVVFLTERMYFVNVGSANKDQFLNLSSSTSM